MSRIDDLLSQMTLEEKISMLAGADLWHSVAVPRLGQHGVQIGCHTGWHRARRHMESGAR